MTLHNLSNKVTDRSLSSHFAVIVYWNNIYTLNLHFQSDFLIFFILMYFLLIIYHFKIIFWYFLAIFSSKPYFYWQFHQKLINDIYINDQELILMIFIKTLFLMVLRKCFGWVYTKLKRDIFIDFYLLSFIFCCFFTSVTVSFFSMKAFIFNIPYTFS